MILNALSYFKQYKILIWNCTILHHQDPEITYTVDSRYLKVEGTLWNTSRYPNFDISELQNWGIYQLNNHISQMNM